MTMSSWPGKTRAMWRRLMRVATAVLMLLACAVPVLLAGAEPASAATLTVCPHGCQFSQIAPAVAAAHNGDIIRIGAGSYAGGVTIRISVQLAGAGPGATRIRGGRHVLTIGMF